MGIRIGLGIFHKEPACLFVRPIGTGVLAYARFILSDIPSIQIFTLRRMPRTKCPCTISTALAHLNFACGKQLEIYWM